MEKRNETVVGHSVCYLIVRVTLQIVVQVKEPAENVNPSTLIPITSSDYSSVFTVLTSSDRGASDSPAMYIVQHPLASYIVWDATAGQLK